MTDFTQNISLRWSDFDPNFHVRHSAYYDYGAQHRIELFDRFGINMKSMKELHIGPVLFREECVFKREILTTDTISINIKLMKMKPDASRWTLQHELKNQAGQLCAVITLDGAWIDTQLRKLKSPIPQIAIDAMNSFPKSEDFVWI